jgi:hypothetical protein
MSCEGMEKANLLLLLGPDLSLENCRESGESTKPILRPFIISPELCEESKRTAASQYGKSLPAYRVNRRKQQRQRTDRLLQDLVRDGGVCRHIKPGLAQAHVRPSG